MPPWFATDVPGTDRAGLVALSHGFYATSLAWMPIEPTKDFCEKGLQIIVAHARFYHEDIDFEDLAISALKPLMSLFRSLSSYVTEAHLAGLLCSLQLWRLVHIGLDAIASRRTLRFAYSPLSFSVPLWVNMTPRSESLLQMADGYNLIWPMMLHTIEWLDCGAYNCGEWVEMMKALLKYGLNINEPCCSFGPPLHSVLKSSTAS